ncbi:MAG TPA: DUF4388 domain-containing protein [Mycobacteriales bacterium]
MPHGELSDLPLTALLPTLAGTRTTGLLTLTEPDAGSVRLWLRGGEVVLGERRDTEGTLRPDLLQRLLTAGLVDTGQAATAREAGGVEYLLTAELLPARRLAAHVTELLLDAFTTAAAWTAGGWELDPAAPVPALASLPVGALLARATERTTGLGDPDAHGLSVAAVPRLVPFRSYAGLDLAPEAWAVLSVADGARSTGRVAAACGLTVAEAVDVVDALVAEGLLRTLADPAAAPVVLPAPRPAPAAAPPLAPVDDLQVIQTPDQPDTAAFLRELSGLTGAEPATPASVTTPAVTAPPAPEEHKPARRRLFGR